MARVFTPSLIAIDVKGAREIQRAIVQILDTVSPQGAMGQAVKAATLFLHKYSVGITHVITGTLQASHIIEFEAGRVITFRFGNPVGGLAAGRIYINPGTTNPVTGERPSEYGLDEHAKGGSHAFYERTFLEAGPIALTMASAIIQSNLPRSGRRAPIGTLFRIFGF